MTTFTIPDAAAILAGLTAWSSAYFTEYLGIIYVVLGLTAAVLGIKWLQGTGSRFFSKLFGGRKGGRRSRR